MSGKIALIGVKLGMTTIFKDGKCLPITLISVKNNTFVSSVDYGHKKSILISGGPQKSTKNINKPQKSLLKTKNETFSNSILKEFTFSGTSNIDTGAVFNIDDSLVGRLIDVRGISKGKGFQGGIKRWGFAGLPASHGVSLTHRSIGSTGNRTLPGRVFKGKKMPGHMGHKNRCVQNLTIEFIDQNEFIIGVSGSVPGASNGTLYITNSVKSVSDTQYINCLKCAV